MARGQKMTHCHGGENDDLEVGEKNLMTTGRSTEKIESCAFKLGKIRNNSNFRVERSEGRGRVRKRGGRGTALRLDSWILLEACFYPYLICIHWPIVLVEVKFGRYITNIEYANIHLCPRH
jgi:hypothetical protein